VPVAESSHPDRSQSGKRTILAPETTFLPSVQPPANRVVSVDLEEDEEVQWTWTYLPDGQKYVSGYTIIKKPGG
jgi:hypothetical protein